MATVIARLNGRIVFTRDYEAGWVAGERTIRQGTSAIVTRVYEGLFGDVTHVDVRLADGTRLTEVEIDYFSV
jgi:hypothetical protein